MPNGHEFLTEELEAVHPGLGAAAAVISGPPPPERPTEALHRAQVVVAPSRARTVLLPWLGVPAWRNDRVRASQGDGVTAGAAIAGAVGGDRRDRLALGDLRQQARRHGRVADLAVGELDGSNSHVRRGNGPPDRFLILLTLVDGQVDLAPDAPAGAAVLARMPFAFAPDLDPGAVHQQVQRAARAPAGQLHGQRLLSPAQRRD